MKSKLRWLCVLVGAVGASVTASGVTTTFDFAKLTKASVMPAPAGELYPDAGFGFVHSNDFVGNPTLQYTIGSLTATVTATSSGLASLPVQDSELDWTALDASPVKGAGLGVYPNSWMKDGKTLAELDPADRGIVLNKDNIEKEDVLTIAFNKLVTLCKVYLRSNGHTIDLWVEDGQFKLNGASYDLPIGVGSLDLMLTDTSFSFAHSGGVTSSVDGVATEDYYVAGIEVKIAENVPESGATLGLLILSLFPLAGLLRARRMNRRA